MYKWIKYNKKSDFKTTSEKYGISQILARILCNRDITSDIEIEKILSSDINDLNDENLLPDIDKATDILIEKISNNKSIRIIGDYDIDGVSATYILYDALKNLGADVSYYIPNRITDGYGMNINIVNNAKTDNIDTILTCDNGISAINEINEAKKYNMTVIVTDHHEASDIPSADAIIDPKVPNSKYPFKDICGAVVAWKLIKYLYKKMNVDMDHDKYLEFICLATIGDIMPIINENHIIAKLGLKKISTTDNKGLFKLLDISNLINKELNTYHIGFIIGPLINAAGRLDDATLALRLFISGDDNEINEIAYKLKSLNDERKNLTEKGSKDAITQIEKSYMNDKVLSVYIPNMNESVAGIVAGRVKEKYNKPSIIFTDTNEENVIKASARSIDNYNMYENLQVHKDMYIKFGGHKGAAGFSMYKKDFDVLKDSLNKEAKLCDDDFIKKIYIDAEIDFKNLNNNLVRDIEKISPYGMKIDKPIFACKNVNMQIFKVYGEKQNVIKLNIEKDGARIKGVIFMEYTEFMHKYNNAQKVHILYEPTINDFTGIDVVELKIIDFIPA